MKRYVSSKNAVTVVVIINLILAVTVLLKEISWASYLGTTSEADALMLAYFLPDTIGNNLLSSAIGVACIPVFSKLYINRNYQQLNRSFLMINFLFICLAFFLITIFYLFGGDIIRLLGIGFSSEEHLQCINLFKIIIPSLLLFPSLTICTALLQVIEEFTIPALAPVTMNLLLFAVAYTVFMWNIPIFVGVYWLAWAILSGIICMALLLWVTVFYRASHLLSLEELWVKGKRTIFSDVKEILAIFFPYVVIILSFQSVLIVERYLASNLGTGTIAGLNYAYRLSQFPVLTFVSAVTFVLFPSMSKLSGMGEKNEFIKTTKKAVKIVLMINVPVSLGLYILRIPVVSILFFRGTFDEYSLMVTTKILAGFALSIVWQSLVLVLIRVFLAKQRIILPMLSTIFASIFNIVADLFLVKWFGSQGLGYGAVFGASLNAILLAFLLKKEVGSYFVQGLKYLIRIILSNIPLCIVFLIFQKIWSQFHEEFNIFSQTGYVILVCSATGIIYLYSLQYFKLWNWRHKGV